MTRKISLLAGAALILASLGGPAHAQGAPQTVTLMKVDIASLANETVGTIDDLIVTPNDKVPFAVLSVGGFLGMDVKYVVVPFSEFEVHDKQMLLRGATKESLSSLPDFKYSY
jgi:hypothetical protein